MPTRRRAPTRLVSAGRLSLLQNESRTCRAPAAPSSAVFLFRGPSTCIFRRRRNASVIASAFRSRPGLPGRSGRAPVSPGPIPSQTRTSAGRAISIVRETIRAQRYPRLFQLPKTPCPAHRARRTVRCRVGSARRRSSRAPSPRRVDPRTRSTPPAPPGPVARPHSCACRAPPGNADPSPPSPPPTRDTETDLRTRLVGGFPSIVPGSVRSTDASRNIYFALPPSLAPPALRATFLYQLRVRKHHRVSFDRLQLKVELVRSIFFDSGFAYFQKPFATTPMARVGKTNQREYKLITTFLAFPSPVAIHLHMQGEGAGVTFSEPSHARADRILFRRRRAERIDPPLEVVSLA